MRNVILPTSASILCRNKLRVGELTPGDVVSGYDWQHRRVVMVTILEVNAVPPMLKVTIPISHFKTLNLVHDTVVLTSSGERAVKRGGHTYTGYCQENPKLLVSRLIENVLETRDEIETVELVWDHPEYIWTDGILVGTNK